MPIVFPRAMPARGLASCTFELERQAVVAPLQGGRLISVDRGPARWRARYETMPLDERRFGEWRAWLVSLRGAGRQFFGQDWFRRFPAANPTGFAGLTRAGGGAFDGAATSWSVDAARELLTLTGLPAGLRLQPGDYVGFLWASNTRAWMARVLEDVIANGSGVGVWQIEPVVPTWIPSGATAILGNPACLMRIVPGSDSESADLVTGRVRFEALQDLVP